MIGLIHVLIPLEDRQVKAQLHPPQIPQNDSPVYEAITEWDKGRADGRGVVIVAGLTPKNHVERTGAGAYARSHGNTDTTGVSVHL